MAETGKSFINKFIGFSLVTWASFAISFFSAPISTRLFIPEILGKINIFNTYSSLFGVLVLIGLDQAFARFYLERPNNRSKGYLFSFCFGITYGLLLILFIFSIPFRDILSQVLFGEKDNLLFWLFFFSIFCSSTLRYLNLSYRMEQNIKMYTIQGILMTFVSKIFYIGVGFWDPSYKTALITLTITHVALALAFLFIQRRSFERLHGCDTLFAAEMFKFALPLIPVSLLMWANSSIPQVVMQKTMDYQSVGIFTSANALASVILIIQAGFNTFWVPYTYENYKTQTGQFFKVHRYLVCILTLCSLILVLSQDVVFLLLGENYRAAKVFFPFLILGPVCYIIGETTGIRINISKKTYYNLVVFGGSVIINLVLCIVLRVPFGISGIAMATGFGGIVAMVLKTYLGEIYYRSVDNYKHMYLCITFIITSAFITQLVTNTLLKNCLLILLFIAALLLFKREIVELKGYAMSFAKK